MVLTYIFLSLVQSIPLYNNILTYNMIILIIIIITIGSNVYKEVIPSKES